MLPAENKCSCHFYEQLWLPVSQEACSLLPAWPGVQAPGVTWYGGDVSKAGLPDLSALPATMQGDWMLTNLSLCFP